MFQFKEVHLSGKSLVFRLPLRHGVHNAIVFFFLHCLSSHCALLIVECHVQDNIYENKIGKTPEKKKKKAGGSVVMSNDSPHLTASYIVLLL